MQNAIAYEVYDLAVIAEELAKLNVEKMTELGLSLSKKEAMEKRGTTVSDYLDSGLILSGRHYHLGNLRGVGQESTADIVGDSENPGGEILCSFRFNGKGWSFSGTEVQLTEVVCTRKILPANVYLQSLNLLTEKYPYGFGGKSQKDAAEIVQPSKDGKKSAPTLFAKPRLPVPHLPV